MPAHEGLFVQVHEAILTQDFVVAVGALQLCDFRFAVGAVGSPFHQARTMSLLGTYVEVLVAVTLLAVSCVAFITPPLGSFLLAIITQRRRRIPGGISTHMTREFQSLVQVPVALS